MKSKRRLKSALLTVLLITSALSPSTTRAAPTCEETLNACDRAYRDQLSLNELHKRKDEVQKSLIDAQDTRIKELEKGKPGFFEKPGVWLVVGLVVGGWLVGRAK